MSESVDSLFDVPDPARCGACDAIIAAKQALEKRSDVQRAQALRFTAVRRIVTEAQRRMPGTKNRRPTAD